MMTRELERRIAEATDIAKSARHEFVTLEHLLLSLSAMPSMVQILEACGVNVQTLRKELREHLAAKAPKITAEQLESYGGFETWTPEFTLACHRLFQRAALQVKSSGRNQINEGTLLVSLFYEQDSFAVYCLTKQGLSQFDVINYISHGITKDAPEARPVPSSGSPDSDDPTAPEKGNALDSFCVNLNERARAGRMDPLIGREDIIERCVQVLLRRTKNNPLIIGEPGVGKTAIAEGLAQRIVDNRVPERLRHMTIYALDMGSLLAGTKFRGDFEGRIKGVIKEAQKRKNVILFIDEIHTIVGAGATSGGSMDASNLLKPALANGELSVIGSTTHQEFRQHFERDRALARRFQRIDVKEPSVSDCIAILHGLKSRFEAFHNVRFSDDAIKAAVELSQKHIHGKLLPDKAIDVMDETGAWLRMQNPGDGILTVETSEVEQVVARMTGLPVASISANEKAQLRDLDKKLKAAIFGQDEAVDRVVAAIKLARSGLQRTDRPIGCFLFTGPTGVGKTELAKQLASLLGVHFHRFDMSEYMEKHSVSRLIGAPPGYVGHEDGGLLTEAVNKHPYAVLLLDEIEKAHPDIYSALLQVMDAGRLTDGQGRVADFKNVILIMTSNAGAAEVARGTIGIIESNRRELSKEALKKHFAPEFLNRLDAIVGFNDLPEEVVLRVVEKFVNELRMLLLEKGVELSLSAAALRWLMEKGYDRAFGARPLARVVDEHLKKPLVDELLFGRLSDGGRVSVDVERSVLRFHFSTRGGSTGDNRNQKETVSSGLH